MARVSIAHLSGAIVACVYVKKRYFHIYIQQGKFEFGLVEILGFCFCVIDVEFLKFRFEFALSTQLFSPQLIEIRWLG